MVVKEIKNKVAVETETKQRLYSFPKEWISIQASSLDEAIEKKNILLNNKNK